LNKNISSKDLTWRKPRDRPNNCRTRVMN